MSLVLKKQQLAISRDKATVLLEVICGDEYLAQILFEDVVERMKSGEGISLGFSTNLGTGQTVHNG